MYSKLQKIALKYETHIIKDGFKPYLSDIINDIVLLYNKVREFPMTFISRLPNALSYLEPEYRKEHSEIITMCLTQRHEVKCGLIEQLQIYETWVKDDTGENITGEMLFINWINRYDQILYVYDIKQGKNKKYLELNKKWDANKMTMLNPMTWPWNTNQDIIEFLNIPSEDQKLFEEKITHMEKFADELLNKIKPEIIK